MKPKNNVQKTKKCLKCPKCQYFRSWSQKMSGLSASKKCLIKSLTCQSSRPFHLLLFVPKNPSVAHSLMTFPMNWSLLLPPITRCYGAADASSQSRTKANTSSITSQDSVRPERGLQRCSGVKRNVHLWHRWNLRHMLFDQIISSRSEDYPQIPPLQCFPVQTWNKIKVWTWRMG